MGRGWTAGVAAALTLAGGCASAAEAPGRWQGVLKTETGDLRVMVRLEERQPGRFSCFVNLVERGPDAFPCSSAIVARDRVTFTIDDAKVRFEGALSGGGDVLEGTWTVPSGSRPLKLSRTTETGAWSTDATPHKTLLLTTRDGVRLEVLDYGGDGPPLIFIPGYGATAHAFDRFAPKLAARRHVYAITRRASGLSDTPPLYPANYSARRLAEDVLEVMDQLRIDRAALAGWSFGGVELSATGHHFPQRVTALVYLDAAYAYAFYAPGNATPESSNYEIGLSELRDKLQAARLGPAEAADGLFEEILTTTLPELEADILAARERKRQLGASSVGPPAPQSRLLMRNNLEKFRAITDVPILSIFALPTPSGDVTEAERADEALEEKWKREQIARYRAAHPKARIIELPGATHDVFDSNPADVLREMEGFLVGRQ